MKKRKLSLIAAFLSLAAFGGVAGCSNQSNIDLNSQLVIGMECNYQPFNWTVQSKSENTLPIYHSSQYADGYDIAVAKYLGEKLNKDVIIKKIEWESLIPSLNSGEINMVLAGMTDTAKRRESISFTNPYLASDLAFLVRSSEVPSDLGTKDNPASYLELLDLFDGKSLVCQSGVVGDDFIDTYFVNNSEGKTIRHSQSLPTYPLAALDVKGGISFAMPAELPVIESMTNLDKSSLRVLYCDYSFLSEEDRNGLTVSIGIKKDNESLLDELNSALDELSDEKRGQMMGEAAQRSANN